MARAPTDPPLCCACPTAGIIDLLGKKWSLCVVATIANCGPIRFNELYARLKPISPKTLSDTLKLLESHGLLTRTVHAEVPPRVEYAMTAAGRALVTAAAPLMEWMVEHDEAMLASVS